MRLKSEDKYKFYICGRCNGQIPYIKKRPKVCPECGYGHGERDVNDVPDLLRLNLSNTSTSDDGSRGITEQATIDSR